MTSSTTLRFKRFLVPHLAALVLLMSAAANATPFVVHMTEQGNDVVAVGTGALDLTGLEKSYVGLYYGPYLIPSLGQLVLADGRSIQGDRYTGATGPSNFGFGGFTEAAAFSGDRIEVSRSSLFLPLGYTTGTLLSNSATWQNATFESLGVELGTYVWIWGSGAEQNFTLVIGNAVNVPEPAALGVFGFGAVLIGGFVALRRRMA